MENVHKGDGFHQGSGLGSGTGHHTMLQNSQLFTYYLAAPHFSLIPSFPAT